MSLAVAVPVALSAGCDDRKTTAPSGGGATRTADATNTVKP
jgi:hypothetical protein